jgi:hypothetical protein
MPDFVFPVDLNQIRIKSAKFVRPVGGRDQLDTSGKPVLWVEIQLLDIFWWKALMEDLTLSSDGHLFKAVVGRRAGLEYQRC